MKTKHKFVLALAALGLALGPVEKTNKNAQSLKFNPSTPKTILKL